MKNLAFGFLFTFSQLFTFAQCPPGDLLIFSSQAEIDDFGVQYPNCTDFNGDIVITGTNIVNLYGLNGLNSIGGDLSFLYNAALSNLTGMEGLTTIGGSLILIENYILTSMSGLNNLASVEGDVVIQQNNVLISMNGLNSLASVGDALAIGLNPKMTSLSGLDNLNSIESFLGIIDNPILSSITGLENLTSIGGDLSIEDCDSLSVLSGLASLNSVGGEFFIKGNPELASFTDLGALTSIGGKMTIQSNYSLTSLSGLDNIDAASIVNLKIYSNTSLNSCEVLSVCEYLANPGGTILISNNAVGCTTTQQVEDACEWVSVDEYPVLSNFNIYPNPASSFISVETLKTPSQNTFLTISNTSGQQLITQELRDSKTEIDIRQFPAGIFIIRLQSGKEVITQKLVVN